MKKIGLFTLTIILVLFFFPLVSAQLNASEDLTNGLSSINEKLNSKVLEQIPDPIDKLAEMFLKINNEISISEGIVTLILFVSFIFIIYKILAFFPIIKLPAKIVMAIIISLIIGISSVFVRVASLFLSIADIFGIKENNPVIALVITLIVIAILIWGTTLIIKLSSENYIKEKTKKRGRSLAKLIHLAEETDKYEDV